MATFLDIDNEHEKVNRMIDERSQDLTGMYALLERADPNALKDFLRRELEAQPNLRARFMARFSSFGKGKSLSDYKEEIDSFFDNVEEHGFIPYGAEADFAPFEDLAAIYFQKDDIEEAAKIYQALTEKIAEKMDNVDDSDGYYGTKFSDFLDAFVECIIQADQETDTRREYIGYLFNRYLLKDPDYFQDDYYDALKELCTSREDLEYWKTLLLPHLPERLPNRERDWSRHYHAKELISMQLHLLSGLKETDEFYALMKQHYRSNSDFCLQYAKQLLEDGDQAKAIQIADEGTTLFPDHLSKGLRDFLSKIYSGKDPDKHKQQLLSLFFISGEWNYYEQLKAAETEGEWKETIDKILAHFAGDKYGKSRLIEIYMREQMHEAALREVMAQKSIQSLRTYHKRLADLYPKEYFCAYKELIVLYAESRMGREHYRDVASILEGMKGIKGFESEVREIVEQLRRENKRKPAFIDELKAL